LQNPAPNARYSRQTILPSVGEAGQKNLSNSSVWLIGEGPALEAALVALASSGLSKIFISSNSHFDESFWKGRFADSEISFLSLDAIQIPPVSLALVLTLADKIRKGLNRKLRGKNLPAVFGWNAGSGIALLFLRYENRSEKCPCFECFEILNPKAFNEGYPEALRFLGAAAASEALLWLITGKTKIENKVWIQSLDKGLSFYHPVSSSSKCPAFLLEKGATVTP
jgi:hypothetical protein